MTDPGPGDLTGMSRLHILALIYLHILSQRVRTEGREPMFNITYAGGLRHLNGRVRRRSHQVPSHPVAILLMAMLILCPLLVTSIGTSGQSRASGDWMESSGNLPSSGMYFGICFGHINDDGDLDLVASSDGDGLRVFLGNGAGGWTPVPDHPARTGGYSGIALADFDKDGKRDIIAGSPGVEAKTPNGLQIFKGDTGLALKRTVITQELLHRRWDKRQIVLKFLKFARMLEKCQRAVTDQRHRRLVAGEE